MTVLQAWLLFGLPALILGTALFVGRSPWRSALGYLVLVGGFLALAAVERVSAGVFGGLLTLLYAAGRGGRQEGGAGGDDRDADADADVPGADRDPDAARTL